MSANKDPKTDTILAAVGALLAMHTHESKHLARLHRQFKSTFHEELAVPPARPISKKSRAKRKTADVAAKAKQASSGEKLPDDAAKTAREAASDKAASEHVEHIG